MLERCVNSAGVFHGFNAHKSRGRGEVPLSLRRAPARRSLALLSPFLRQAETEGFMRCLYREKQYKCGDFLEVDIFPVFAPPRSTRKKKAKPTTEVQRKLNQHNAEQKLIRLANTNFTKRDIRFDLTYSPENEPESPEEAQKKMQNFFRRIKRFRKKHGLPELKYIAVTETGENGGRLHHHIIMNGEVSINDLAEIWGLGYTTAKPLQFNEFGIQDLSAYLVKRPILNKRWNASKNLIKPKPSKRDGKLSARRVKELCGLGNDAGAEYERLYDGYFFAGARPFYNDYNGGFYLCVRMYRKQPTKKRRKGKKNE